MATKTDLKVGKWKSVGASLLGDPAATAGSSRIYYYCEATEEWCYRDAGWSSGFFRDGGKGYGVDPESGETNGKVYSAGEFD